VRRRPSRGKSSSDLIDTEAGGDADRRRREPVVDGEPAERRDCDGPVHAGGREDEAHSVGAGGHDVLRSHVGVGREAVRHHPSAGPARHPADTLVVGVEHREPAVGRGGELLDELGLGSLDGVEGPDPRQVDGLDRGDDADHRPADAGQIADLAADVHPHLEDGCFVIGPEA
jgi:hypothetical protein